MPKTSIINGPHPPRGVHDEPVSTDNNAAKARNTALHRPRSFPLFLIVHPVVLLHNTPSKSPAMSPSPALPWEVIERVIDHSADNTEMLRSFALTSRHLQPRSTFLLLGRVTSRLKNRNQLFALCAFLQTKPHLPCVRSVTIPAHEFSPDSLLRILPNLSNIELTGGGGSRLQKHYHVFVLNHCRRLGHHIQTLSLRDLHFCSLSAFSDILLLLPRIESLSCERLRVDRPGDRVHEEFVIQRLSKRLHLKALTVSIRLSHCHRPVLCILTVQRC